MRSKFALAELIETRLRELHLDPQALGHRLGYTNPAKAAGRVHALAFGHLDNKKSRAALSRLPKALDCPTEQVEQAILETRLTISEDLRASHEREMAEREAEEAKWRRNFRPHGVILTENRRPSQITFCALTGGPEARLIIPFDLSRPAVTFVTQSMQGLKKKVSRHNGRDYVLFFGEPTGLVINYSPDLALRCDLQGNPIEWLSAAYRIGRTELIIGGKAHSSQTIARVLGLADGTGR